MARTFHALKTISENIPNCRVHPDGGKLYFEIAVYPTIREMQRQESLGHQTRGAAISQRIYNRKTRRWSPRIGRIALSKSNCGVGVISHEMTHAALQYLAWRKKSLGDPWKDANEPLCYLVGKLTSSFYTWAYERNIL